MTYYYCNVCLNNLGLLSFISACGIVPVVIINFFVPALTKRFVRRNGLLAGAFCNTLGFFLIGIGGNVLPVISAGFIIKGLTSGGRLRRSGRGPDRDCEACNCLCIRLLKHHLA